MLISLINLTIYLCLINEFTSSHDDELWNKTKSKAARTAKSEEALRPSKVQKIKEEEPNDEGGDERRRAKGHHRLGAVIKMEQGQGQVQGQGQQQETGYKSGNWRHFSDPKNGTNNAEEHKPSARFEANSDDDEAKNEEKLKPKGEKRRRRVYSDEEKQKIVKEFLSQKEGIAMKLGKAPNRNKLEEIAAELGVSIRSIFHWKKEFEITESKEYIKNAKENVVRRFNELKNQDSRRSNAAIAKELNITESYLMECLRLFQEKKRCYTESEKREFLRKFYQIKRKSPNKGNAAICKKLGIAKQTLSRWKTLFEEKGKTNENNSFKDSDVGISMVPENNITKRKILNDDEKQRIVKEFLEIKMSERGKKAEEIAAQLGVCIRSISNWKRQFGIIENNKTDEKEKREIVKQYKKIKRQNPHLTTREIAREVGINEYTLDTYRKHFERDYKRSKVYSEVEKLEKMRDYHQMKRKHPEWNDEKICKKLKIIRVTLCSWKKQFAG